MFTFDHFAQKEVSLEVASKTLLDEFDDRKHTSVKMNKKIEKKKCNFRINAPKSRHHFSEQDTGPAELNDRKFQFCCAEIR